MSLMERQVRSSGSSVFAMSSRRIRYSVLASGERATVESVATGRRRRVVSWSISGSTCSRWNITTSLIWQTPRSERARLFGVGPLVFSRAGMVLE